MQRNNDEGEEIEEKMVVKRNEGKTTKKEKEEMQNKGKNDTTKYMNPSGNYQGILLRIKYNRLKYMSLVLELSIHIQVNKVLLRAKLKY